MDGIGWENDGIGYAGQRMILNEFGEMKAFGVDLTLGRKQRIVVAVSLTFVRGKLLTTNRFDVHCIYVA
jgi:hypothetical protein